MGDVVRLCKQCGVSEFVAYQWVLKHNRHEGLLCLACNRTWQKARLSDPILRRIHNIGTAAHNRKLRSTPEGKAKRNYSGLKWAKQHAEKCATKSMLRLANKLNATPKWLTKHDYATIAALYAEAKTLQVQTGIKYQIDHIIPLRGKNVCGLHVPSNLQILTATDNKIKGNAYV